MPRPKSNGHAAYDGTRHAPGTRANQSDRPQGDYAAMTTHATKHQQAATMAALDDAAVRGWGWNNGVTRWNPRAYEQSPTNKLGVHHADDTRGEQRYAPGGMLGQLHSCATVGKEMHTLPFEEQYATY